VVSQGATLLRVDDQPVTLMYGSIPQYRSLGLQRRTLAPNPPVAPATVSPSAGAKESVAAQPVTTPTVVDVSMSGSDVQQFEANLHALDYRGFDVDRTFTTGTASAVKRWQHDTGQAETGRVEMGSVVFLPGPVRIASIVGRVGAPASSDVLTVAGLTKFITADVPANDPAWASGVGVRYRIGTGAWAAGRIRSVDSDNSGGQTATLVVAPSAHAANLGSPGTPATIERVLDSRADVFSVPVTALVALAEGGFGIQLDRRTPTYLSVHTGLFAQGRVEISGPGLAVGLRVRMPL
jgi:peptidoglycan hydrolase-like protein with peptidoglycan-binding domain